MIEVEASKENVVAQPLAVLVVDDESDLRDLLTLTLVRMGLDADSAESVGRARELMASRAYSLICATPSTSRSGSGSGQAPRGSPATAST